MSVWRFMLCRAYSGTPMPSSGLCECVRPYDDDDHGGGEAEDRHVYRVGEHKFSALRDCPCCGGNGIPNSADQQLAVSCWAPARNVGRA